ncbi:MAG: hypothetical protein U9R13_05940 [Campylobacterota bacterium]|nr:hypothetical protein [Campylobacterota bacterium]
MKKLMGLVFAVVALFALSGCGGGNDYYEEPINDGLTTLFLIDQNGDSYAGIPYKCDSMADWSKTAYNGEFSFYPGENCEFDFLGLYGNYEGDPYVDDIVYIVDDLDYGKGGIPYECASFGVGTTYGDGSFDYDIDDECVFYL